jgi:hypothetical protein
MKKTMLSLLTITAGILLTSSSFAANMSDRSLTAGGSGNPMLHPELETSFIVTSNPERSVMDQANEHYGLAPAWNHQESKESLGNQMLRPELETSFIATSGRSITSKDQVDENYGLAPSWNYRHSGKTMGSLMLRPEVEMNFMNSSN